MREQNRQSRCGDEPEALVVAADFVASVIRA
jgi:hypothetical protein